VKQRPKVGEILVKAGVIDELQLRAALGEQSNWGGRLGVALVKMGLVEEHDLVRALAQQLQLPVVQLEGKQVQQEVLDLLPGELAEKHLCVPLFVKDHGGTKTLFVGMDDPGNLEAIDDLSFRAGVDVQPVLVSPSELCEAIDRFYHRGSRSLNPVAGATPAHALSMDPRPARGAAAKRRAVDVEEISESLFPDVGGEEQQAEVELEVPADLVEEASAEVEAVAVEAKRPAADESSPRSAGGDPSRAVLRALCQLLVEKGVIGADELRERVAKLGKE